MTTPPSRIGTRRDRPGGRPQLRGWVSEHSEPWRKGRTSAPSGYRSTVAAEASPRRNDRILQKRWGCSPRGSYTPPRFAVSRGRGIHKSPPYYHFYGSKKGVYTVDCRRGLKRFRADITFAPGGWQGPRGNRLVPHGFCLRGPPRCESPTTASSWRSSTVPHRARRQTSCAFYKSILSEAARAVEEGVQRERWPRGRPVVRSPRLHGRPRRRCTAPAGGRPS